MSNEQDVDHFMALLSGEIATDDELGLFATGLRQHLNQKRGEQVAAALFDGAPHTALSSERDAADMLAAEIGTRELPAAEPLGEAANDPTGKFWSKARLGAWPPPTTARPAAMSSRWKAAAK